MIKNRYDVVVVGAGPGGSTFSKEAAKAGLDVLLIEKRKEIGVPKRCGEGITSKSMKKVGLKPEPEWVRQKINGIYIYSPSMKRVDIRYKKDHGYTIERKRFDKWLAERASDAGATVMAGTRAIGVVKDNSKVAGVKIKTAEKSFDVKSNIVVAADGAESMVARWAGMKSTHMLAETCSGIQFEMSNIDLKEPDMLHIFIGNNIVPGGYVWIFPKGKRVANVGLGTRETPEAAYHYLKRFVENNDSLKNGSILEINGGSIPVGNSLKELSMYGLMAIGDAAHQVNPIHGGGIIEAMLAAKIAAKIAVKAHKAEDFSRKMLSEYDTEWYSEEGKRLNKLVNLRKAVELLSDDDLNYLANELSGEDVLDLVRAKDYSKLAKIFMKRPSLVKLVPKLLSAR